MIAARVCTALTWVACMLMAAAGCSGTPAHAPVRPVEPETAAPAAGTTVTLYRDGAVVRDRRSLAVAAGTSTVAFDAVAHSLIGARPTLVSLSEPASMRVRTLLTPPRASAGQQIGLGALIGREVTVYGSGSSATGVLSAVEDLAGQTPSGQAATALVEIRSPEQRPEQPVERVPGVHWIDSPADAWVQPAPGRLAWTVQAARSGVQLLEATYTTDALPWRARYTLVVDAEGRARRGRLQGWLELENRTGVALAGADVQVLDSVLSARTLAATGPRVRPMRLTHAVDLAAGASTSRLLVDVQAPTIDEILLYDPIGTALNHQRARPIWARSYGTRAGTKVHRIVRLAVGELGHTAELPAGELLMLQRNASGAAAVVGQGRLEPVRLPEGMVVLQAKLGVAAEVQGQRQQREYSYDPQARRLVEEIGVTLHNRGNRPVIVLVNEHLYRGLSWTIGYHNDVGNPRKAGPQAIYFTVSLAAGERALIMYRVVYTW